MVPLLECRTLTKKYGSVLRYASNNLLNDANFMKKAISLYNGSIKYIGKELRNNNNFIDEIINIDKWNKEYLKKGNL